MKRLNQDNVKLRKSEVERTEYGVVWNKKYPEAVRHILSHSNYFCNAADLPWYSNYRWIRVASSELTDSLLCLGNYFPQQAHSKDDNNSIEKLYNTICILLVGNLSC